MSVYYDFTCFFENCLFHKRIVTAASNEIKNHFKRQHDYTELLEKAVEFRFIKDILERRSPDWFAEKFFEYSIIEIEEFCF